MNNFFYYDWQFGLEQVVIDCKNKKPILEEIKEKEILTDKNKPTNLLIEGDNYHALTCLQKTHKEKVDVIYIDPPYNTGNKKQLGYKNNFSKNRNTINHFLWATMMERRLLLSKNLLCDSGVIFISIDNYELANLKLLCDKIFEEENFIGILSVVSNPKGRRNSKFISLTHDYCVVYAKNKKSDKCYFVKNINQSKNKKFKNYNGSKYRISSRVLVGQSSNKPISSYLSKKHYSVYYNKKDNDLIFKKENNINDIDYYLLSKKYKRYISAKNNKFIENTYTQKKLNKLFCDGNLIFREKNILEKERNNLTRIKSVLSSDKKNNIDFKSFTAGQQLRKMGLSFYNPKNVSFIKLLLSLFDNKSITVLDFFAGSGTTGQAVLELNKHDNGNRSFILCTNNENEICDKVTYPRIKKVVSGYYDNKNKYNDGLGGNLKYYKTDFK